MSLTKASYSMIQGAVANILDYGAVADYNENTPGSGTDNSAAIQAAVDAVDAQGVYNKGAVYIPAGSYKILSAIDVPYGVSIFGAGGTASVLHAENCDGLNFTSYGYQIGSMFYEDFGLTAATGTNRAAITALTNASTMDGLYFHRLRFYGWNQCLVLSSNWNCTISECVGQNINQGVTLAEGDGEALGIRIINNRFTKASGGLGSADEYAINLVSTTKFIESVHILTNQIFGFTRNVNIGKCYFANIVGNDFSGSENVIYFDTPTGGYTVQNNFIEVVGASGCGIYIPSVGLQDNTFRTEIRNNNIQNTAGSSPYGIDIGQGGGSFQWNILVDNNTVSGFATADLRLVAGGYTTISNNRCISASATQSMVLDTITGGSVAVENNRCVKAITLLTVSDYTSGKLVLSNNTENGVFQPLKQSVAPTTGTWRVTDIVMSSAPTIGQPKGWVCTVAGTPGTWVSIGNL
tara:strand:+ start:557 stop:1951 length:1395 start_codon:yes stop_codon:yes gene_type:complete